MLKCPTAFKEMFFLFAFKVKLLILGNLLQPYRTIAVQSCSNPLLVNKVGQTKTFDSSSFLKTVYSYFPDSTSGSLRSSNQSVSSQSQPSNQSVSAPSMFESALCNALYFGRFTMTWFKPYNDRHAPIQIV